jgi:hypothetical protein
LNPARDTAIDPSFRFKSRYETENFLTAFNVIGIPSAIAFVLLTVTPGDRSSTIFGWRLLAHLGPYQVPELLKNGRWKSALEQLERSNELQLIESEISQLLTDIEVVTQRRQCVRRIVSEHGFSIFQPVLTNLSSPPPINCTKKGQSHFEANLRVAMDIVTATPAKDRTVPIEVLENLITHNKELWESTGNEEVMRFREYRALLLLKLLQNRENAIAASESKLIREFLDAELIAGEHVKFSTLPLMPLLYQFKTEKLGYEYSDIIWKCLRLLDQARGSEGSVDVPPTRKSLTLDHKIDFLNFEKMIYFTICYASLRVIPFISEYSFPVLKIAAGVMARSVLGVSILESIYRFEEHVIQSRPYFEVFSSGSRLGCIAASAGMVIAHTFIGAFVLRKMPFCFAPFALMKIRDSFTDSFRFL